MSSSSSDSDFSDGEDAKMQAMLDNYDKDATEDELYVDSDDDSDDEDAAAKKAALKKKQADSDSESEEEAEESDEEEEEVPKAAATDDNSNSDDSDDDKYEAKEVKKKPKKKRSKAPSQSVTDPDPDDDEEDAAMKELLANWDAENAGDDDDEDDDDDDEDEEDDDSEVSERELDVDDNALDHIVLAAGDLEEAMKTFHEQTGVEAVIAGTIKGLGIKCARVSFENASYIEIIAPDPKGPGPIGELLKNKKIKELTPFHFAIRTSRAEQLKDEVSKFGYTPDHITMFGSKADGTPRKWEMLYLYGHKMGGVCPFFINWNNSDHPCATLPIVGKLKKVTIRAPEDDPVHQLLDHFGKVEGLQIEEGKKKFSFSFKSPEGTVKFSSDKPVGFKFPGFEADVGVIDGDDGDQDAEVVFENPTLPELLPVGDVDYEDLPPPAY